MRTIAPSLILAISAAILAAAYSAQYIGGVQPCPLCLYQRFPWLAAGGMSLVIVVMQFTGPLQRTLLLLTGILLLVGSGIGLYHVGVEQHWWAGPGACSAQEDLPQSLDQLQRMLKSGAQPRCDEIPWQKWGLSMAGFNAIISFGTAVLAFAGRR